MDPDSYRRSPMTADEQARHEEVFGGLAAATRGLLEAQLVTEVDHDTARDVTAQIELLTARLRKQAGTGSLGVVVGADGRLRALGNAVVGLRNPVAPPLHVERSADGRAWSTFVLGPQYEGPPGLVHGGVSALLLDQLCGEAASAGGAPGMTGRLTLHYRRPTPLGELSAEAWIERVEGYKTLVTGRIADAEGRPTVEAEGLFILPRWARGAAAAADDPADPAATGVRRARPQRPERFE
jgi:acyl-coenzyme A thioesterase PaaI-like protein